MKELTCAGFFSGAGGIELGFQNQGFNIVYSNEIDPYVVRTFELNFKANMDIRDIKEVRIEEIPDFDVLLAGFPCQPFSIAGNMSGFDDKEGRGMLFFELERIFRVKQPKVIFLENVKNLVNHNNGDTFRIILSKLEDAGYYVKYEILNSCTHGNIPQNRERIYIVAFKDESKQIKFKFPEPITLITKLKDFIGFDDAVESKYFYSENGCKFYNKLEKFIINPYTIYQWRRNYARENKKGLCPTLTANMGTGGNNVPIILTTYGIRKLTPKECFNLQGFPRDFILPDIANTRLYKQAGNSVVVSVISRIAEEIKKVMESDITEITMSEIMIN